MDKPKPIFIRIRDAGVYLGISKTTIYRWKRQGKLRIHKHGNCSWLKMSEIEDLLESGEGAA